MERRTARIEPVVGVDRPARRQAGLETGRPILEQAAPGELGQQAARIGGARGRDPSQRRGREASERAGRGETCPCPALCYRDREHANQPRAASAPSPERRPTRERRRRLEGRHRAPPVPVRDLRPARPSSAPPPRSARYGYYSQGLEDPKKLLETLDFAEETVVYDRTGKIELARFGQVKRDVVEYDQIPPWLIDATTSIEDKTFWENAGFDPIGIVSAAIDTAQGNERGASTITQQLVRAQAPPAERLRRARRYERKIREIIQSIRLTQEYQGIDGKKTIMTAYLNQNFYGNRSYGIKRGGEELLRDRRPVEADPRPGRDPGRHPPVADLVRPDQERRGGVHGHGRRGGGLPGRQDGAPRRPTTRRSYERRNKVLDLMQSRLPLPLTKNTFTTADFEAAKKEPVVLHPPASANWLAPHFVWQVRHQLGSILCGADLADTCEKVDTGGYKVITTLDWGLQKKAEKWVKAAAIAPNRKDTAAYLKSINVSYCLVDPEPQGPRHLQRRARGRRLPDRPDHGLRRQRVVLREAARQEVPAPVRRPRRWLAPGGLGVQADQLPDRHRGPHPDGGVDVHGRRHELRRRLRAR